MVGPGVRDDSRESAASELFCRSGVRDQLAAFYLNSNDKDEAPELGFFVPTALEDPTDGVACRASWMVEEVLILPFVSLPFRNVKLPESSHPIA